MQKLNCLWLGLALVVTVGVSTPSWGFPWKKVQPLPYVPPYFGYYPNQWREFPVCEETNFPTETLPKPNPTDRREKLPDPMNPTIGSSARGTAPSSILMKQTNRPTSAIPALDPVPQTEIERFRLPLATLGEPITPVIKTNPAASLEGSIQLPEGKRIERASAPEKD